MPDRDFDPYRDTTTAVDETDRDEPFADWPRRSLNDPMGEVAGYGRLARGLASTPAGKRRWVGRSMVAVMLAGILIPLGMQVLWHLTP